MREYIYVLCIYISWNRHRNELITDLLKATEPKPGLLKILAGSCCSNAVSSVRKFSLISIFSEFSLRRSDVLLALLRVPQTSEILPRLRYDELCCNGSSSKFLPRFCRNSMWPLPLLVGWRDFVSKVLTYITSESRRRPVRLRTDFLPSTSIWKHESRQRNMLNILIKDLMILRIKQTYFL